MAGWRSGFGSSASDDHPAGMRGVHTQSEMKRTQVLMLLTKERKHGEEDWRSKGTNIAICSCLKKKKTTLLLFKLFYIFCPGLNIEIATEYINY